MNAIDLSTLDGKSVLVCSARDHRNPTTGRRGTLRVCEDPSTREVHVEVDVGFPQMYTTTAHSRTIVLSDRDVAQMLETEKYGAYTVFISDRLDPAAPPDSE